ncbi:MAG: 50S ribosomal protein L2 [Candidatus Curtissbacteria bacterium GW2011_GWA1_41_11]|uniref:Large ribosomal subunit protein uL2 n=1 Tax=Candidatus Curtissbacteria bacterium GW2011_GWA1_41_11 TaxID=1618409 RepID=A0A0G0WPY4_9BACT|nr:MAG: 50S ribosomal protein L2 [Candidatus Curtissbacteria bacterium GW2011_GWA1_41_11]
MPVKQFKPTTPSQRFKTGLIFSEITKTKPEKTLVERLIKTSGRSNGIVTVRGRGGGHKRNLRVIDFKRDKRDVTAIVAAVEYDPNRSANIALLHFEDGEKNYILAPNEIKIGDKIQTSEKTEVKAGNAMPLKNMPIGSFVHNIELTPGGGGKIVRSAGASAIVAAKEGKYVHIKLPSREVRKIHGDCFATIGQIGNVDWKNRSAGKAGKTRHLGRRPKVRGVAMDPASHPHGGGEGRSGIGMNPKTPTGKPAFRKTRNRNKPSSRFILSRRKK